MLVTILSTGGRAVKKIHENICSGPVYILVGRDIIKKKFTHMLKGVKCSERKKLDRGKDFKSVE